MNIRHLKQLYYTEIISKHIIDKINSTKIDNTPFKHCIINDFFPQDFYNKIDANFPCHTKLIWQRRTTSPGRLQKNINDFDTLNGPIYTLQLLFKTFGQQIASACLKKFNVHIPVSETTWSNGFVWNLRDEQHSCILPHLDVRSKILSFVIYFPFEGQKIIGTDILEKKDHGTFNIVKTAEANPNSCLVFAKTDNSWHQARPTPEDRRTLTCFITHKNK